MPVISTDLGKRIVEAFGAGGVTKKEIAARFDVSRVTAGNLVRLWREEGALDPRYKGRSGMSLSMPSAGP